MGTRIFCARCSQLLPPQSAKDHQCPHGKRCEDGACRDCARTGLRAPTGSKPKTARTPKKVARGK